MLKEAERLHAFGFAVLLLHQRSKRPIESKWTTGKRASISHLRKTYKDGNNIGVRLGEASLIGKNYLACIDVDIKDPKYKGQALRKLKELVGDVHCPSVRSGSGNGSRHLYCVTAKPFKMLTIVKEKDKFEICVYSTGRQMVLPPSIHPDTGKKYEWVRGIEDMESLPVMDFGRFGSDGEESDREANKASERSEASGDATLNFTVEPVELEWLPISKEMKESIVKGTGVTDRSGFLLPASTALFSAGLNQNEVLTVLTDPNTFLGATGYSHTKSTDRSRAAQWVFKYTVKRVAGERDAVSIFSKASLVADRKLTPEEVEKQNEDFRETRPWQQDIIKGGQKGDGPPKSIVWNVVLILKNAVSEELFLRNEFAVRDIYGMNAPWGGIKDAAITDDDVTKIKYWLSHNYNFEPKNQVIEDAMIIMACENAFDPVKYFLDHGPEWDGVNRLDSWLLKNFEAEGDPEYLAQVFRKWMVAMVMRVYRPGAKFDWMPIFEGAQGVGKSSFGRLLVGDKHFLDWLPNLADKDSALALQGIWGAEMGELSQFRKSELEVIKGFITRTIDKIRPPYGRRWLESPRRCVFFGTTNRETYLIDDTGNRRFKPIKVGALNFDVLRRDRLQLFAEAKYLFDQKIETERSLELIGEAKAFEVKIQSEKLVEDDSSLMTEVIRDFVEKFSEKETDFNLSKFSLHDLFQGTGPLLRWKFEQRSMQFAAKALKKLGAVSWKSDGRKVWKFTEGPQKHQKGEGNKEGSLSEDLNNSDDLTFM